MVMVVVLHTWVKLWLPGWDARTSWSLLGVLGAKVMGGLDGVRLLSISGVWGNS